MNHTPGTFKVHPPSNRSSSRRRRSLAWLLGVVIVAAAVSSVDAATPLHRCARESWPAENYHAYVFHHGGMDPADQELVDVLASAPARLGVNLLVSTIDTAEPMQPDTRLLWEAQTHAEPPWLVVQTPLSLHSNAVAWSTALGTPAVGALLASPVRDRIATHLIDGHAGVWLLVESGEAIRDEAAVDTLTTALAPLAKRNPTLPTNLPQAQTDPVTPQFSLLRITRADPAEQFLLQSLGIESDSEPLPTVFPVFGRGRTLPPLVGRKLNGLAVAQVCRQLLSECTNSFREITSGSDLLLAANWETPVSSANLATNVVAEIGSQLDHSTMTPVQEDFAEPRTPSSTAARKKITLEQIGGFAAGLFLAALAGFAVVRVWRSK